MRETIAGLAARARSLWRGLRRGPALQAEMDEEFRLHQELRAADLVRSGLSPAEAARRARLEFGSAERWKHDGVRVIPGDQLDSNVPSTAGMDRKAAINFARVGAQKLWAGTVTIRPDAKTGAHHHGHLESIIYVVKGKARMRWGEHLQFTAEAGPGDFIFVPPYVPHQEINASPDQVLECVLVRSDGEAVAINLDIEPVEKPETVLWVDPVHRDPAEKK